MVALQAASCTYRIAFGPRAGQKVLTLRTVAGRDEKTTPALCAEAHGFSLHAGVRCGAHQRKELERLCRYITRPAIANERLKRNGHLTRFHGVLAPNARLRAAIVPGPPQSESADEDAHGAAAGSVPGGLILKVTTVLQWA